MAHLAITGQSTDAAVAAVKGENTSNERSVTGGEGVLGISNAGCGVQGISTSGRGVVARSDTDYALRAHSQALSGVRASSDMGVGVEGEGRGTAPGVVGTSKGGIGVHGKGKGAGVVGEGDPGPGVIGKSTKWVGVYGETAGIENGPAGVWGEHKGAGVGVKAVSKDGVGLAAYSTSKEAIRAVSHTDGGVIAAYNRNAAGPGFAIYGKKEGSQGHAGFFEGNVWISGELGVGGDITLANADCAEDFDVFGAVKVEPGTVMVLGDEGALFESRQAYDKRVAGVISGAGDYKPGIVLDKRQTSSGNRQPVALLGKVFCKVDAQYGAIEVGDLLTSSPTPGHAMKTDDPFKAFGAVIGKALRPLTEGQGLIPILIALQ